MRRGVPVLGLLAVVLLLNVLAVNTASAYLPSNHPFYIRWSHTDEPVSAGMVARTWMWGLEAFTPGLTEEYGDGRREVQYYDKARMEINDPDADPANLWYVTNGLLVVELITGRMQIGDNDFVELQPSETPVAGDTDVFMAPTYAALGRLLDEPAREVGELIATTVSHDGAIGKAPALSAHGATAAHYVEATGHTVASPFWEFMNSTGLVSDGSMVYEGNLFPDPFYATGYPITEAHWTKTMVGGTQKDVLVQAFERRVLTYTPDNPEGWKVESGNVGWHYHAWRYSGPREDGHEVLLSIPVGPEGLEYQYGSNPPDDALNSGPNAISVAPDGTFWIADSVRQRLAHYSQTGEKLNEINLLQYGSSMVMDVEASTSDVWALFADINQGTFQLAQFIPEGQLNEMYDLHDDPLVSDLVGYTPGITATDEGIVLQAAGGEALVRVVTPDGAQDNTDLDRLIYSGNSHAWQYDTLKRHVLHVNDHEVVFEGMESDFAIETDLVDQVSGNSFVVEVVYVPDATDEAFRYTAERIAVDGTRLGIATLPTEENFVFVQFDLTVDPDGAIYQMVTYPERIDVLRLNVEPAD